MVSLSSHGIYGGTNIYCSKKCKLRFYEGRIVDDCFKYALNQREGNLESSEEYSESNNNEGSRDGNDEDEHSGYESADDHELRHFRRIHLINHVASDDVRYLAPNDFRTLLPSDL